MKNGRIGIIVHYHNQPPLDTPAKRYTRLLEYEPDRPIREVFEDIYGQIGKYSSVYISSVEIPHQS